MAQLCILSSSEKMSEQTRTRNLNKLGTIINFQCHQLLHFLFNYPTLIKNLEIKHVFINYVNYGDTGKSGLLEYTWF